MTVRANKPAFSIREKLKELDYAHVPYDKMPAGTIIQHKFVTRSADISTSDTTTTDVDQLFFTPRFSNSLLELGVDYSMGATAGIDLRLYFYVYNEDGSNGIEIERTGNLIGVDAQSQDAYPWRTNWTHYYYQRNTETKLYKFRAQNLTGSTLVWYHTYGSATTSTFWIKEIKQ
jgi:hypothetical protein